jgi:hypothetical protein
MQGKVMKEVYGFIIFTCNYYGKNQVIWRLHKTVSILNCIFNSLRENYIDGFAIPNIAIGV